MRVPLSLALFVLAGCGDNTVPTLSKEAQWSLEISPCWDFTPRLGDVNGDTYVDLVVMRGDCSRWSADRAPTPDEIVIFAGHTSGFDPDPVLTIPLVKLSGFDFRRMRLLDLNGDGREDIDLSEYLANTSEERIYFGSAAWSEVAVPTGATVLYNSGSDQGAQELTGDVDGDGRDERIDVLWDKVSMHKWDDTAHAWVTTRLGYGDEIAWAGDVDGDGAPDLVAGGGETYRFIFGCPNTSCLVGETREDHDLPAFETLPYGAGDLNGDGYSDLLRRSVGGALLLHLGGPDLTYGLEPSWQGVPDASDQYLYARRGGDFDGDGSEADWIVGTRTRTLFFASTEQGPDEMPSYEWQGYLYFGKGPGERQVLFYKNPASEREPIVLEAYRGGRIPEGPRPRFQTEFSCPMRDVDAADISVDRELIARSLGIRSENFSEDACELAEACIGAAGERRLLDFSVAVQNFGGGIASIPGPALQPELWHADQCHGHDHLVGFASYELLDESGEVVLAGHKQGYYIVDVFAYCDEPSVTQSQPIAADTFSISPGWADIYPAGLPCQWIDITGLADGQYTLRVEVNRNGAIPEDNVISNVAEVAISITGDTVRSRE